MMLYYYYYYHIVDNEVKLGQQLNQFTKIKCR